MPVSTGHRNSLLELLELTTSFFIMYCTAPQNGYKVSKHSIKRLLPPFRAIAALSLAIIVTSCAMYAQHQLDQLYGQRVPTDRKLSSANSATPEYHRDIEPIIEQRCVVCHGCYDAPCQLKMDAFAGIDRGANKNKVYDGARLLASNLTRLFEDAQTTEQWREKKFYPILNERKQTTEANLAGSTLYQILDLKRSHPLPTTAILADSFDFSLNRDEQCPKIEEFDSYKRDFPLWGMPYGLPALTKTEFNSIKQWIETGAKYQTPSPVEDAYLPLIKQWETFFNGDSLKKQLTNRYIYEHLFVANLYFGSKKDSQYFKLIRSSTAPGQEIQRISTRRPYDNPGVDRVYYRLQPVHSSIVAKNHMPYRLDNSRLQRWEELFVTPEYTVSKLPSYEPLVAGNPFKAFAEIPVDSRYKFMLDEAQFTIMGFIKGPVCRGQIALSVIQDRFWVLFIDPKHEQQYASDDFIQRDKEYLRLPSEKESNVMPITAWLKYSKLQQEFLKAKRDHIKNTFPDRKGISLDLLWDGGEEKNENAALTIFRHFDSATVTKGFIGDLPKTAWVIGYPLLERIHYLLVAGFDVYGNVGHQLVTRLYMDFLRMEGEYNFLLLIPEKSAEKEISSWYIDSENEVGDYIDAIKAWNVQNPDISYHTENHKQEFFEKLFIKFDDSIISEDPINWNSSSAINNDPLKHLAGTSGAYVSWLPEISLLRISSKSGQDKLYTLIANRAHKNVSHLFRESSRIIKHQQSLTIVEGVLGDYPNVFYHINNSQLAQFVETITALENEEDYKRMLDSYAVRRTSDKFWAYSDWLNRYNTESKPIEAGILDYNRLQNR